jgi:copper chaperone CopZ
MAERTVSIPNISCGHCVKTIERELSELSGVEWVGAEADGRTVTVRWDEGRTSWDAVEALLQEIDYPPAP